MAFTKVWTETDKSETKRNREDMSEKSRAEKRKREKARVWVRRSCAEKSSPSSESVISRLRVYRKNPVN